MICTKCKTDNKEGAVFCAQCGAPLAAPVEEKIEAAAKKVTEAIDAAAEKAEVDDEGRTTVLTSNTALDELVENNKEKVLSADKPAAPDKQTADKPAGPGFVPPTPAPMPMNNGAPMGRPPMMNGTPMGQPPMMNGVPNGQPPMKNGAPNGKPEKAPKAPKPPKAPKAPKQPGAMKTGTKVYIAISIVLILGLIGTGVWGFLHFTKQVDDLKKDKSELQINLTDTQAECDTLKSELESKDDTITGLNEQISTLNDTCSSYESQIGDLQNAAGEYATYDPLINFAKSAIGQGYDDFFVSDTVVHLTGGETAIKLYFAHEGDVLFTCEDTSVASCEWSDSFENNVASLYVTPQGSGNTTITITNSVNDEAITIYVFVD